MKMRRIAQCLIPGVLLAVTLSAQDQNPPRPPLIFAPGDLLLSNDPGLCTASGLILEPPKVKDFTGGHTINAVRNDGFRISEPYPRGRTLVTWTVTDAAGQIADTTQFIIVRNTESPDIKAPPDIEVTEDDSAPTTTVDEGEPTVSYNCPSPRSQSPQGEATASSSA